MKKKFCMLLAALLLTAVPAAALDTASGSEPYTGAASLTLDGRALDTGAVWEDGVLYLPVRSVCEALGYSISWSQEAGTASARKEDRLVTFSPGQQTVTVGDQVLYVSPFEGTGSFANRNGRLFLSSDLFDQVFPTAARYDVSQGTVSLRTVAENELSVTSMTLNSQDEHLTVSLRFPQFSSGPADQELLNGINSRFLQAAGDTVEAGLAASYDLILARAELPDYASLCASNLDYRITLNRGGLLCALLTNYYYAGGAHGSALQSSYLFDLSTGNPLSLSDLMKPDSGYTALVDAAIRTEIDRRTAAGILVEFEGSEFKTVGEDPACYLTNDAVVFYFQQYEYFPYAAGIQTFAIPYSELSACLREEYAFLN